MRLALIIPLSAALFAATSLSAEPPKPAPKDDVSVGEIAATPLADLNLTKSEIPAFLIEAQQEPYSLSGLSSCPQLVSAIADLNSILGDDVDIPAGDEKSVQPGQVAKAVVGGLIPFGGIIREVSGANGRDRRMQAAIASGAARRSFLKGTGQARGCAYPARSAVSVNKL